MHYRIRDLAVGHYRCPTKLKKRPEMAALSKKETINLPNGKVMLSVTAFVPESINLPAKKA